MRDRDAVAPLADDVQVGVELGIAGLDRLDVRTGELVAGDVAALEQPGRLFRRKPQGVDHSPVPLGRLRGHPMPPPAFSLTRESARVCDGVRQDGAGV